MMKAFLEDALKVFSRKFEKKKKRERSPPRNPFVSSPS
jgi:hypothetical protein